MSDLATAHEAEDMSRFFTRPDREQTEADFKTQAAAMTRESEPAEETDARASGKGDKEGDGRGDATGHMAYRPTPGDAFADAAYGRAPDTSTDSGLMLAVGIAAASGREQAQDDPQQQPEAANTQEAAGPAEPQQGQQPQAAPAAEPEAPKPQGRSFEELAADGANKPNYTSLQQGGDDASRFTQPSPDGPKRPGAEQDGEDASRFINPEIAAQHAEAERSMEIGHTRARGLDFG